MKKLRHSDILKAIHDGKSLSDLTEEYSCSENQIKDVLTSSNSNPNFVHQLLRNLKKNEKKKSTKSAGKKNLDNSNEQNAPDGQNEQNALDGQNEQNAPDGQNEQNAPDGQNVPDTIRKKSPLTLFLEMKDSASSLSAQIRYDEARLVELSRSIRTIDEKLLTLEQELQQMIQILNQKHEELTKLISDREDLVSEKNSLKLQKQNNIATLDKIHNDLKDIAMVSILAVYPETLIESKLPLPRDFSAEYTKNDFAEKFSMFLESGLVDNITPSQGRYILAIFEYCKVLEKAKRPYSVEFERADYQALFKSLQ